MYRKWCWQVVVQISVALVAAPCFAGDEPRDLYFSEALYYAHQGHYFEALERLDTELGQHYGLDEPQLDSLYPLINDAEFFLGLVWMRILTGVG